MKEGWEYKTLGECCDIYNGNSINSDYKMKNFSGRKEGYPFIATKDVSFNGTINYDNGIKIPFGTNYKIAFPDSVFICAEGGSAGRKIALVNKKVCFGNKLFCIAPLDNEEFIGKYIYYYMNSALFQNQFKSLLTGLIGGVSAKKFRDILLIKIPLDEQRRIVSYLDSSFKSIDEIKDKALKSLTEAKALFQSALAEAMEPKEGWEEKTLGEICLIVGRIGFRGYTRKDIVTNTKDGAITLSPSNIVNGNMCYNNCTYISWFKYNESPEIKIQNGDILMVKTGSSYGKSAFVENLPHKATINPQFVVLKDIKINHKFLSYQLKTKKTYKYINSIVSGSAIPTFSQANLSKMLIGVPNIPTQHQIVSHLDSLSSKVRAIEEKYQRIVAECDAMKQAMLREVFE